MPSFSDNIKPDEAWDLVFYLRTLQPDNTKEKQIAKQLDLTPINPLEPLPSSDSGQSTSSASGDEPGFPAGAKYSVFCANSAGSASYSAQHHAAATIQQPWK